MNITTTQIEQEYQKISAALSLAKVGFYEWNILKDVVVVSRQFAEIWKLESGQKIENAMNRVHPEDRARVRQQIECAIQNKTECKAEYRLLHDNGKIVWVESQGKAHYDAAGNPYQFFGVSVEITERKQAEDALSVERKNLENLFDFSTAFVATTRGPHHVYQYVNPAHVRIVGANFTGRALREAIPHAAKLAELFDRVFHTGVSESNIELPVEINSRTHYMNANYVATRDSSGAVNGVIALGIDVTGEIEARKHAEKAVSDLQTERVVRERFVETITHDLRTPMTAARMSAQLLERKSEDPHFVRLASKRIIQSVDRSNRMIVDLLDANSIKAGSGIPVKFEFCRMSELVNQVVADLSEIHGLRFHVTDHSEGMAGHWDAVALQRIVENLVVNAVKYGTPKSIITITLLKHASTIEIGVHNQGNPISHDDQLTIFSPYRRTDQAKAGGQVGWGIGLTLVKGLTEAHRGKVRVESFPETGTTFYVEIPFDSRSASHA